MNKKVLLKKNISIFFLISINLFLFKTVNLKAQIPDNISIVDIIGLEEITAQELYKFSSLDRFEKYLNEQSKSRDSVINITFSSALNVFNFIKYKLGATDIESFNSELYDLKQYVLLIDFIKNPDTLSDNFKFINLAKMLSNGKIEILGSENNLYLCAITRAEKLLGRVISFKEFEFSMFRNYSPQKDKKLEETIRILLNFLSFYSVNDIENELTQSSNYSIIKFNKLASLGSLEILIEIIKNYPEIFFFIQKKLLKNIKEINNSSLNALLIARKVLQDIGSIEDYTNLRESAMTILEKALRNNFTREFAIIQFNELGMFYSNLFDVPVDEGRVKSTLRLFKRIRNIKQNKEIKEMKQFELRLLLDRSFDNVDNILMELNGEAKYIDEIFAKIDSPSQEIREIAINIISNIALKFPNQILAKIEARALEGSESAQIVSENIYRIIKSRRHPSETQSGEFVDNLDRTIKLIESGNDLRPELEMSGSLSDRKIFEQLSVILEYYHIDPINEVALFDSASLNNRVRQIVGVLVREDDALRRADLLNFIGILLNTVSSEFNLEEDTFIELFDAMNRHFSIVFKGETINELHEVYSRIALEIISVFVSNNNYKEVFVEPRVVHEFSMLINNIIGHLNPGASIELLDEIISLLNKVLEKKELARILTSESNPFEIDLLMLTKKISILFLSLNNQITANEALGKLIVLTQITFALSKNKISDLEDSELSHFKAITKIIVETLKKQYQYSLVQVETKKRLAIFESFIEIFNTLASKSLRQTIYNFISSVQNYEKKNPEIISLIAAFLEENIDIVKSSRKSNFATQTGIYALPILTTTLEIEIPMKQSLCLSLF
ncbi:MAG: hypothetical protein ABIA04_07165 [Pseudomonadota bacterium]